MVEYFQKGLVRERSGNKASGFQPLDAFQARDGWVVVGALGEEKFAAITRTIGLDPADDRWQGARTDISSVGGIEWDALLRGWIAEHSVNDVVEAMNNIAVPAAPVMTAKDIAHNPQYEARNMHIEWEDGLCGRVKGIGVVPKFSQTPGKIWRGVKAVGADNDRIYGDLLGVDSATLVSLRQKKVI